MFNNFSCRNDIFENDRWFLFGFLFGENKNVKKKINGEKCNKGIKKFCLENEEAHEHHIHTPH